MEVALPIVYVDDLRIWCVITQHHIQVAIPINVDQAARVRPIGRVAEIVGRGKVAPAVAEKHPAPERPMPSLDKQNVEIAISIQITHFDVGRRLGSRLKQEHSIKAWKLRRVKSCTELRHGGVTTLIVRGWW